MTIHTHALALVSDPLNTSKSDFAILGDEVNGRYYDN
jgi:hypothetical protein